VRAAAAVDPVHADGGGGRGGERTGERVERGAVVAPHEHPRRRGGPAQEAPHVGGDGRDFGPRRCHVGAGRGGLHGGGAVPAAAAAAAPAAAAVARRDGGGGGGGNRRRADGERRPHGRGGGGRERQPHDVPLLAGQLREEVPPQPPRQHRRAEGGVEFPPKCDAPPTDGHAGRAAAREPPPPPPQ